MKTVWDKKNKKWVNVPDHWVGHRKFGVGLAVRKSGTDSKAVKGQKVEEGKNA